MKALVVDDEPVVLELACRVLERAGFETVRAANGHDALKRCDEHKGELDIVISDVTMPGLTGLELAHCIQKSPYPVPVILMSGHVKTDPAVKNVFHTARLEHFNFLRKPFRPKDLIDEISIVLRKPIARSFPEKATGSAKP